MESDSLGSGVSICSLNTRVGVVQSRSRVECGVRARGVSILFKEYEGWSFAIPKVGWRVIVWAGEVPLVPGMRGWTFSIQRVRWRVTVWARGLPFVDGMRGFVFFNRWTRVGVFLIQGCGVGWGSRLGC